MNADYGGGKRRTWDGLPVVDNPPFGTTVVVYRHGADDIEMLLLHRRAAGPPGFDGDWAWTPPSGARQPSETVEECARRELLEETGLELACTCLDASGD